MSKISDELRKLADSYGSGNYNVLYDFAYRIDDEMVELPKDKDGITINVGDTVYADDSEYTVQSLFLRKAGGAYTWRIYMEDSWVSFTAYDVSHVQQDSLERIAQELEDMSEHFRATDKESFSALLDFAERIREQEGCGSDD